MLKQNNKEIFIHGIGHSLGAHIMGNIYNFGGVKLNRISGLDPAGPCFEGKIGDIILPEKGTGKHQFNFEDDLRICKAKTKWGLNADAAEFVDNYHTDGKYYGTYTSMGDIDFFLGKVDGRVKQQTISQMTDL